MTSLDIINLIENTPITKLSGNYQSKLIEKIKNNFTEYEQQIFLSSFYCYLNYTKDDFVIDLDNIWEWLGFSQKDAAKRTLEKQFIIEKDYKNIALETTKAKDYKNIAPPICGAKNNTRGGHNKQIIMLNIETFKRFCLKAGTKKADEIHEYFIKLEIILQEIIKEESDELQNQLRIQLEEKNNEIKQIEQDNERNLQHQKILERENILLNQYSSIQNIVYIIKVKSFENKSYVIKIGESRKGITSRYKEHTKNYDECILLECFAVNRSHDFEKFIHNHEKIRGNRVNDLSNHETELELFLIGRNLSYKMLLDIINNNISYFNSNDTHRLELENEKIKLLIDMNQNKNDNILITELIDIVKTLSSKIDNLEKSILEKFNQSQNKITTGFGEIMPTIGPRLQQINPDTLELIKFYETASDLMRENTKIKRPSLNKAVLENTIYNGYRYLFVDRELDPNIIHNIEPTRKITTKTSGYIAKLNKEQTEILNVYLDRKSAAILNEYSPSGLDNAVQKYQLTKNNYYKLYEECDEDLIENFEEKYEAPLLYKNGAGQYDLNNNLIQAFSCKYDAIRTLKISDKTLAKCLDKDIAYNNFYYKSLLPKIQMVE